MNSMNKTIITFLIILDAGLLVIVGNGVRADVTKTAWQNPVSFAALVAIAIGLTGSILCSLWAQRRVK